MSLKYTWSIRAYREGDEEGIFELWKAVRPELEYKWEHWIRWWHWMYKENPAGNGRIWLAEHNGKMCGQYAIVPVVIKVGSKNIIGAQSLDTMTHPNYRHQGIFETLAKYVYREAHKDGIDIVYGFPNKFSYPGFIRKLDWFDIATTRVLLRAFNWRKTLETRISNRFLLKLGIIGANLINKTPYIDRQASVTEGLTITQVSSFDERIRELWTKVCNQYPIMVVRDKDYLNWRYVTVPDGDYFIHIAERAGEICGYIVLGLPKQELRKVAIIFDILIQSEEAGQSLVSKAVEYCKQNGVDLIYCSLIANKTYVKCFRKNGFIHLPLVKGNWFCAYSSSDSVSDTFLKPPQNWFVQIGDSDRIS